MIARRLFVDIPVYLTGMLIILWAFGIPPLAHSAFWVTILPLIISATVLGCIRLVIEVRLRKMTPRERDAYWFRVHLNKLLNHVDAE